MGRNGEVLGEGRKRYGVMGRIEKNKRRKKKRKWGDKEVLGWGEEEGQRGREEREGCRKVGRKGEASKRVRKGGRGVGRWGGHEKGKDGL